MNFSIENLNVFRANHHVLKDIHFTFSSALTFILGNNGSGKSTLLSALQGLIPYKGIINLDHKDLKSYDRKVLAQYISWVPQLVPPSQSLSVSDYVLLGRFPYLTWMGNFTKDDHEEVEKALAQFEMSKFASRSIKSLSGGEWRAVAQSTPILLLDEPTQSMDPLNRIQFYRLLNELTHQGKKVICTTHHLEALQAHEGAILGLASGKMVYEGMTGEDDPAQLLNKIYRAE